MDLDTIRKCIENLETTVTCPICFTVPATDMQTTCKEGHQCCLSCLESWEQDSSVCPTCRDPLLISRSLIAQKISEDLELMTQSLLDTVENQHMIECNIEFCYARVRSSMMMEHIIDRHNDACLLVQKEPGIIGEIYDSQVSLQYKFSYLKDYAMHVENMGLFLMSIFIKNNGDLMVDIRCVQQETYNEVRFDVAVQIPTCEDSAKNIVIAFLETNSAAYKKFDHSLVFKKDVFHKFYSGNNLELQSNRQFTLYITIKNNE